MSYLAGGMAITIRGRQASRKEAPILVVAPHSSFLDSCIVYATKMSSVIVRKESMDNYVGKLINYTQPVYVWRDDPNSRQNTIKEIIERATSKEDWPQVLIFPEGTCTNRSCLITFKPGGFYPGVPVQPVTIRYPNARDTVTWTWEGPGALKLLWLTLTQVHSSCEIEFLPVYYPSEEEKRDPKLYARNVRDVMAKALGVPVLDYTYDDCRLIARAKQLGIPCAASTREISEIRAQLGLERSQLELQLCARGPGAGRWVGREEFARRLALPLHHTTHRLFDIFMQRSSGLVYFPDYLLCAAFLSLQNAPLTQLLSIAFKLYDGNRSGRLSGANFEEVGTRCLGLSADDAAHAFAHAAPADSGQLTYDEFIAYAQKKAEFSFIFASEGHHKPKSQ
ncbi:lysophosphatidylcholine acyltransferase [Trichoplusia ni]|uniref:Lysophosphatidylcholine acyltransferase n=1 Tax=Trichoplusia ni TaxID=7111 RepID=A0A7E5WZ66_TRINI|nr:lysophosphatidylcholine acyltransferase [Trichoplusia ni]